QTKLSDVEAGSAAYDLYGWMFEIVRGLAFQGDMVSKAKVEPAAHADGVVRERRNIKTAEGTKAPELHPLTAPRTGHYRDQSKQDEISKTHHVSFLIRCWLKSTRDESDQRIIRRLGYSRTDEGVRNLEGWLAEIGAAGLTVNKRQIEIFSCHTNRSGK